MPTARAIFSSLLVVCLGLPIAAGAAIIIDHSSTDIWAVPEPAIEQAKTNLHIAYGHTSHGGQIISGMGTSGGAQFDEFMTANGATPELYLWNAGGANGALDLRDTPFSGANDLGNPDRYAWELATRNYLGSHPECNVIIWSWCGQASTTLDNIDIYLNLMEGLIADYPGVHFVFMTGHLDGTGESGLLNLANNHIRAHCLAHDRILYDFADIESYDPDALTHYMPLLANDNCDYDSDGNGSRDRNWALDWQDSHIEGVDWWPSGAAHSQHLNGNRKGYAAWWLWARLGGWTESGAPGPVAAGGGSPLLLCAPNPAAPATMVRLELAEPGTVDLGVFSLDGRCVAKLHQGSMAAGVHVIPWSGTGDRGSAVDAGMYFVRVLTETRRESQKVLVVK